MAPPCSISTARVKLAEYFESLKQLTYFDSVSYLLIVLHVALHHGIAASLYCVAGSYLCDYSLLKDKLFSDLSVSLIYSSGFST